MEKLILGDSENLHNLETTDLFYSFCSWKLMERATARMPLQPASVVLCVLPETNNP